MTGRGRALGPNAAAIRARALVFGLDLSPSAAGALEAHAQSVLDRNALLHLTAIVEPGEFLERHLGEAFQGAAMLPAGTSGTLLDLGSGNGYPGIPIAVVHPGLHPVLAESSRKKAAFLVEALALAKLSRGRVLLRNVQHASDLDGDGPLAVIVSRAMGGWEKVVPKVAKRLAPGGKILIWAGADLERILRRVAWRGFVIETLRPIPGRTTARIASLRLTKI